jgi:lysozyme family protein
MKSKFDRAHVFTAKWEGGFINHPNDPGGATNFGVSLRWLKDEGIDTNGDGVINIEDIRALTPGIAASLFKKHFWDLMKLEDLPPLTAIAVYDAAVNTGRGQATKFLQRACNALPGDRLVDDGALGPLTRARVSALVGRTTTDLLLALSCLGMREVFHNMLAANSPYPDGRDYRPFRRGWLNRTADLCEYVNSLWVPDAKAA